jgi:hypothetical protein
MKELFPQTTNNNGYETVILEKDGVETVRLVHELVAETFLGPCPKGQVIHHGPGGKLDNSAANLYYGPPS